MIRAFRVVRLSCTVFAGLALVVATSRVDSRAAAPGDAAVQGAAAPAYAFAEPGISPDGREIAFVSGGDIWVVPAAGGDAHLLVADAANDRRPLYAPDGTALAFVSDRTGGGDIYVLTFASGVVHRVTWDDGLEQLDGWSRDGRWIYFSSNIHDIAGMNDVWRVPAAGGTPMPVSADRYVNEFGAAPAPDGRHVALVARGISSSQWWRRGAATSTSRSCGCSTSRRRPTGRTRRSSRARRGTAGRCGPATGARSSSSPTPAARRTCGRCR
ncbi:MAG: hypothetical protein R2752_01690 [Vicinamibacterales bacterium]